MNLEDINKILIIGKRGGVLHWYEHLLDAGEDLDTIEVKGFALNHNNFYERATKKITGSVSKSLKEQVTAKKLSHIMTVYRPKLVIVADMFYFSDRLIKVFKNHHKNCRFVHWIGDFYTHEILRSKEVIHHYFFTDTALVDHAKSLGLSNSSYLPLAYNPKIFYPPKQDIGRSKELLFIGAWSENRQSVVRNIGLPMLIIGKGWGKYPKRENHRVINKNVPIGEVAKLYRKHTYVLNIINTGNIKNGLNMRCFEAPGCKALLITDDVLDLAHCYSESLDVLVYNTASQIPTLLSSKNRESQDETIENGHSKVQSLHTYKIRIESIINYFAKDPL